MNIQIENYTIKSNPSGTQIAEFDVYLPKIQMKLRYLRLLKGKHEHFVAFPSKGVEDGMGGKKFVNYVEFSPDREKEFKSKVIEALKPYVLQDTSPHQPTYTQQADLFARASADKEVPF